MTTSINTVHEVNLALQESKAWPTLAPILKRFEHMEVLDYMTVAQALLECHNRTMDKASQEALAMLDRIGARIP